jgi:hypothetical protein
MARHNPGQLILILLAFCIALFVLSGCEIQNNCRSNSDCKGGTICLNGKCTTLAVYRDVSSSENASPPEEKKEPVVEVTTLCDNQNPDFSPSDECYRIRARKYANRMVCDYTVGAPTWYNMGACYNCIVSCR